MVGAAAALVAVTRVEADVMLWLAGWYAPRGFFLHLGSGRVLVGVQR